MDEDESSDPNLVPWVGMHCGHLLLRSLALLDVSTWVFIRDIFTYEITTKSLCAGQNVIYEQKSCFVLPR